MGRRTNAAWDTAQLVAVTWFWRSVDQRGDDECWPWLGYAEYGYGRYFFNGRMMGAHELAVTFTTGERRHPDLDTCHSCDNPICCNPRHLRFGTRMDNVDDMYNHGRGLFGERSSSAKITNEIAREIRVRRANGARQSHLAAEFGLSAAWISDIVNGLVWQDAGGPITGRSKREKRTPNSRRGKAA